MKIQKLMTTDVKTCKLTDTLSNAAQAMWASDLGCLPVVDGACKLVGMITDRDICMAAHLRGAPLWSVPVSDAMAKVVFSCKSTDGTSAALELMTKHQLRRIPIVDDEQRLVGLVTLGGLAQAAAGKARKKAALSAKDVAGLLAAVTAPRAAPVTARLEVEVTRAKMEQDGLLQPAPRKPVKAPKAALPRREKKSRSPR